MTEASIRHFKGNLLSAYIFILAKVETPLKTRLIGLYGDPMG